MPSRLKTATILSPRFLAFCAAVTLVHGVCSSLQNRNRIVRSEACLASTQAISRTPTVPIALSLAPGESIQLCESLWASDDDDLVGTRAALLLGVEIVGRVPGVLGHGPRVLRVLRFAGVPAIRLHPNTLSLDAIAPRLQSSGEVVVGFVQRVLLVAGQGEVQLAIGKRVLREIEQVLRHPLDVDGAKDAADARLDTCRLTTGLLPGDLPLIRRRRRPEDRRKERQADLLQQPSRTSWSTPWFD